VRRNEKKIEFRDEIDRIIEGARICRLAMARDGEPYLIPLNFGYDRHSLHFHSAGDGKKLEILKENPRVWFEIEGDCRLIPGKDAPCGWGMAYESVMGGGRVVFIIDLDEKIKSLDLIMARYSPGVSYSYPRDQVERTAVFRVEIESISGKRSPAPAGNRV
jgi:hypothetical protein